MRLSVIVPAWNEERAIGSLVTRLRELDGHPEVVVADGQSTDGTAERAGEAGATVVRAHRGRGEQMHAGAIACSGDVLWFVHADAEPAAEAPAAIAEALADPKVMAGNFRVVFDGGDTAARRMTWIYPKLRRLGLCYGDSGFFMRREVYFASGGFRPLPLFEDLDLLRRLRRAGRFVHLETPIGASSRRFAGRRFYLAWAQWIGLQGLYWAGVSADRLARWYRPVR
jgi:rSAM/selenodomain-associated transferase 2